MAGADAVVGNGEVYAAGADEDKENIEPFKLGHGSCVFSEDPNCACFFEDGTFEHSDTDTDEQPIVSIFGVTVLNYINYSLARVYATFRGRSTVPEDLTIVTY